MASAVPPPVGLSSPANMVAYPPADSLISVRALPAVLSAAVFTSSKQKLRSESKETPSDSSERRSLLWIIVSSLLSLFLILCHQPLLLFGILGWPGSWWDVLTLDHDLDGLLRESRYVEAIGTFLAMVRPTLPGPAPEELRRKYPLIAWLMYSEEAKVYVVGRRSTAQAHAAASPETAALYVNGICTTARMARTTGEVVGRMLNSEVEVVHNPTDSAIVDLIECIIDKFWMGRSWIVSEPSELLHKQLTAALLDKRKEKVILVAHSQGTIVACDVLCRLWKQIDSGHVSEEVMKKLEIYNFANCGHVMHQRSGLPYIENISNQADNVAMLGAAAPADVKYVWQTDIDGRNVWPATYRWGHMILTHYLEPLLRDKEYKDSQLHDYIARNMTQRLAEEQ